MSGYDEFVSPAERAERKKTAARRRQFSREQAVEFGGRLGEDEARSRREVNSDGSLSVAGLERVARARAYAAWEYDGKPPGFDAGEFGVDRREVLPSLERQEQK